MNVEYFDFVSVANKAGITPDQLQELYNMTLAEYFGDRMMAELRMLRTCTAILEKYCTIEEVLDEARSTGIK